MEKSFYDVKAGKSVKAEVVEAVQYKNGACAFKGKTKDGRNLTLFVKKAEYDAFKGAKKCCKK